MQMMTWHQDLSYFHWWKGFERRKTLLGKRSEAERKAGETEEQFFKVVFCFSSSVQNRHQSCLQWYFTSCGQLSGSCHKAHSTKAYDNADTDRISEPWPLLDTLEHPDSWKNEFQDKHSWLKTHYWYYIWYTNEETKFLGRMWRACADVTYRLCFLVVTFG